MNAIRPSVLLIALLFGKLSFAEDIAEHSSSDEIPTSEERDRATSPFARYLSKDSHLRGPSGLKPSDPVLPSRELTSGVGTISGNYFLDTNFDGLKAGERGVTPAFVALYDDIHFRFVVETVTDAHGNYRFDNVSPLSRYAVFFEDPTSIIGFGSEYEFVYSKGDSQIFGRHAHGFGEVHRFAINGGDHVVVNAGIFCERCPTGTVSGRYFLDTNRDGYKAGEPGVGGAKVWLYDDIKFRYVAETYTNAHGDYRFDGVTPLPRYAVFFQNPKEVPALGSRYEFVYRKGDSKVFGTHAHGFGEVDRFAVNVNDHIIIDAGALLH